MRMQAGVYFDQSVMRATIQFWFQWMEENAANRYHLSEWNGAAARLQASVLAVDTKSARGKGLGISPAIRSRPEVAASGRHSRILHQTKAVSSTRPSVMASVRAKAHSPSKF